MSVVETPFVQKEVSTARSILDTSPLICLQFIVKKCVELMRSHIKPRKRKRNPIT